jgi:4-alpha-glucanotransferase
VTDHTNDSAGRLRGLHRLARFVGVQTAYYDVNNRRRQASPDALLAALRAFGVELDSPAAATAALDELRHQAAERGIEPVAVAWNGEAAYIDLMLPEELSTDAAMLTLHWENGDVRRFDHQLKRCPAVKSSTIRGRHYVCKRLPLPDDRPAGYHRVTVESQVGRFESQLIAAPRRAYSLEQGDPLTRSWGCFLPLYALQSAHSLGAGDFGDLQRLMDWTATLGGGVVGTLPLLATYLNEPFDPSPYSPVSRVFWNEFYIDVQQVPEFIHNAQAQEVLSSPAGRQTIRAAREAEYVDYRGVMDLKRRILEILADQFFREKPPRFAQFQQFLQDKPQLQDYARFRAVQEKRHEPWTNWPDRLRDGRLEPQDCDLRVEQYYLYAQWVAWEQLQALARHAEDVGTGLYLDLPLGVRPDGFDVWRSQRAFVVDATAGAPPDAVFTKGQDWGFSPLHPQGIREQKYEHVVDYIRHHLEFARFLRIDHVMGLHRLYWIPRGMPPHEGVYVQYRAEELYAIVNLESHRHRAVVVGENLGTVPDHVNRSLSRHHIRRMYVVEYEFQADGDKPILGSVPRGSVASLNTHDMPNFAAWWQGDDIPERQSLGLIDSDEAAEEEQARSALRQRLAAWLQELDLLAPQEAEDPGRVMPACLNFLASGPADMVLVNLEDLWLEQRPQNMPGTTGDERPNWRRKARYSFEEFCRMPPVIDALQAVDRLRKRYNAAARGNPEVRGKR